MKSFRSLLLGIFASIALITGIALLLPSSYQVEREVFIQAPPRQVFEQINTLTHWPNWAFAGWGKERPSFSFSGPMDGQGAICTWQNGRGSGRVEIISSTPFEQIQMRTMLNGGAIISESNFQLLSQEGGTLLTMEEKGDVGFKLQTRLLIALGKVEESLGERYEVALQALKAHCEGVSFMESNRGL